MMCRKQDLRILISLHEDSRTFEWLVVQELEDGCLMLEHDELSSWSSGPLELADWLTAWAKQAMAVGSSST